MSSNPSIGEIAASLAAASFGVPRMSDIEVAAMLHALEQSGGNRTHAARLLGVSVRTIQRKLKTMGAELRILPASIDEGTWTGDDRSSADASAASG
jgi:DNA-binding NtrC family response regulator